MNEFPKITIITPSYNQGHFIEQTILSVVEQQYPNLEYFIIDGGSTDNTVDIIKKYEEHITYWVSEKDKGQSHAINKGLDKASGQIINWLNSDDYYEPHALFKVATAFNRGEHVKVVCGRSRLFKGQKTVKYSNGTDVYTDNLAKTIGWARIDQPETFFKAEVVKKMGLLDNRLHYLMDRDWWIKYLLLFGLQGVVKIPDILVNFRLHEDSKTVSQNDGFQVEHDTYFYALARQYELSKYAEIVAEVCQVDERFAVQLDDYEPDEELLEEVFNYYLFLRANEFYAQNEPQKAQRLLEQINTDLLAEDDQKLWKKLKFRNKYIPQPILNIWRNTVSKIRK
ncbi:glycosyltransferase family 2 protein [Microscilla marina]|uniref:Glycosyltransferase n=1 Tax=Microscilla marina ATCC 23134 TaxID=313606 RepID=A1ZHR6_MICM2|nr:glycosyltransferase family 2 protein [Microscilla marina]EAY30073.1 glycosyltransferase [Microscilla marina ATCC 23134]